MKVGDYVRTNYGIGKIDKTRYFMNKYEFHLDSNKGRIHNVTDNTYWNCETDIVGQPSDSPIDLIEVGDILSFEDDAICRVMEITDNGYYLLKDYGGERYYERKEYINELTSIVTKEQFSSMKYEVN